MAGRVFAALALILLGVALGHGLATGWSSADSPRRISGRDDLGIHRFAVSLPADLTPEHMVGLVLEGPEGATRHLGHGTGHEPGARLEVAVLLDAHTTQRTMIHQAWIVSEGSRLHMRWEDEGEHGGSFQALSGETFAPGQTLVRLSGPDGTTRVGPGPRPVGSDEVDLVLRAWLP